MAPTLSRIDAAHFLRRVGFGGLPAELDSFTGLTRDAAVDRALDFSGAPSLVPFPVFDPTSQWAQHVEAIYWWLQRMVTTSAPLQEKLTLFWHGHFTSATSKVYSVVHMFGQNLTLRSGAIGDFGDLCKAIAVDSAMLEYLDNARNVSGAVNENFARELMELFTLGRGAYTQADVVAMARAWTGHNTVGWTTNGYDYSYRFDAAKHDGGAKTLFGITRAWDGPDTIDEIVHGSKRAVCARHIARKLYAFLVAGGPTDAQVQPHADAFAAANMSIRALVRSLLLSDEFWSPAVRYRRVKSPVELAVEVIRRTGIPLRSSWAAENGLAPMGQMLFDPPNVAGWGLDGYWCNSASMWGRGAWLSHVRWEAWSRGFLAGVDSLDAADAVQRIFDAFGIVEPTAETRARLHRWFGRTRATDPTGVAFNATVAAATTPEFQLA